MLGRTQAGPSIADRLLVEGRYQEAVEAYLLAVMERPDDPAVFIGAGSAYEKLGEYGAAEASFRRAVVLEPNDAEAQFDLGRALSRLGRDQEAEAPYREAIRLRHDYLEAHARLGYLLADQGKADQASKEYAFVEHVYDELESAKRLSDDADLYVHFGRVLKVANRRDDAERAYTRAVTIYQAQTQASPHDPDVVDGLGFALDELGRSPEAVDAYQRAVRLRPKDGIATFNLGVVLENTGDFKKAVDIYRRAIELLPEDPDTYASLGAALAKAGRYQEAETQCRKALAMRDDNANALFGLAIALQGQEQFPEAEQAFERSLALDPDPDTARRLAQLLILRERPEDAEAVVNQSLASDPSWRTSAVRAAVYAAFGDKYRDDAYYGDCVDEATHALKPPDLLSKQDSVDLARVYYQRAYAYSLLSKYGKAKADFRACIDRAEPNSVVALSARRAIRRINSRWRRPVDVPGWLPYLVTLLALGGMAYGGRLVELGKLPPVEYFPLMLGFILVIFAAFSLPTITTLKLGPAELDKQVVVVSIAPPEKLK